MLKYTVKRLLQSLFTILAIVTIVFLLLRMLPTDYFFTEDELMKMSEQQKHDQLERAGFLDPMGVQLMRYYGSLLRLDFGNSRRLQVGTPVIKMIGERFVVSMRFGLAAMAISIVLGVMLGIIQTLNKDGILDHIGTAYTIFVNAVPSLVSYSLILIFGQRC